MARILIVDDEANICWALQAFLETDGHVVEVAGTAADALARMQAAVPDLVITDVRLPGTSGLQMLERVREIAPSTPVIVMTAFGNVDAAVGAMHRGAFEYLHKPLDLEQLKRVVEAALRARLAVACETSAAVTGEPGPAARLVGRSAPMRAVYKLIGLVSQSDVTVLVEGESGVGKELVARAIHDYSPRAAGPFVAINCGSVPEALLESELFGFERGAFTGAGTSKAGRYELAHGGTLFLDEVAELSSAHQAKLLRVLEDGRVERLGATRAVQVDVRVIASTNRSLRDEVAARRFREDLYFRLQVVTVRVPPLRERREDLADLVLHFLALAGREVRRELRGVDVDAMAALLAHDWPGNVRELENVIRRAAALSRAPVLGLADLPAELGREGAGRPAGELSPLAEAAAAELRRRMEHGEASGSVYHEVLGAVESALIKAALSMTSGNRLRAAELLGVHRATLRRRIGPDDPDSTPPS